MAKDNDKNINIYELPNSKKAKYNSEFNDLPIGKSIYNIRLYSLFVAFFSMIVGAISESIMESDGTNLKVLIDVCKGIFVLSVILFILYSIYRFICFHRWLKIKYDIKY